MGVDPDSFGGEMDLPATYDEKTGRSSRTSGEKRDPSTSAATMLPDLFLALAPSSVERSSSGLRPSAPQASA